MYQELSSVVIVEYKFQPSLCFIMLIVFFNYITVCFSLIQNSPARIVFLNMYEEHAAEAMCVVSNYFMCIYNYA